MKTRLFVALKGLQDDIHNFTEFPNSLFILSLSNKGIITVESTQNTLFCRDTLLLISNNSGKLVSRAISNDSR